MARAVPWPIDFLQLLVGGLMVAQIGHDRRQHFLSVIPEFGRGHRCGARREGPGERLELIDDLSIMVANEVNEGHGTGNISTTVHSIPRPRSQADVLDLVGRRRVLSVLNRASRGRGSDASWSKHSSRRRASLATGSCVAQLTVQHSKPRPLPRVRFREVGVYETHGCLDGQCLDVIIVERLIPQNQTDGGAGAPCEPASKD